MNLFTYEMQTVVFLENFHHISPLLLTLLKPAADIKLKMSFMYSVTF